jgi:hypothetical protein
LTPGGRLPSAVEFFNLGLNARNDIVGVLGSPHHDDRGCNVILVIPARDPEPRHIPDGNACDILDLDGKTVRLG